MESLRHRYQVEETKTVNFRDPKTPMGTLVLITVFLVMTIVLWLNVYLTILSRGATQ